MKSRLIVIAALSPLLFGCSFAKHYPNEQAKNVTINLHLEKNGGLLTSAHASAGVNDYKKDCTTEYMGYVDLNEGATEMGLAVGQPTYLIVEIGHKTLGSSSSTQRGTALIPKAGVRYQIDANYVDGMFDFRLYELSRGGKRALEIASTIPGCKS